MKQRQKIRELIISNPQSVRNLILTNISVKLVKLIMGKGSVTAAWLAEMRGTSIQNASAQLRMLYLKGYLSREQITSAAGGIEYIYKPTL